MRGEMADMLNLSAHMCKKVICHHIPNITYNELRYLGNRCWKLSVYHYPNYRETLAEFIPHVSNGFAKDCYKIMVKESVTDMDPLDAPVFTLLTAQTESDEDANYFFPFAKESFRTELIERIRSYRVTKHRETSPAV